MPDFSSVSCAEVHGQRQENYNVQSGFTASVVLQCAWSERYALMADVIGKAWPEVGSAWAGSCSCVPMPGEFIASGQSMEVSQAIVTVNYGPETKDLLSESLEPTAEFQIQDHLGFRWGAANGDPLLPAEAPGLLYRGLNLVRTMYRLPAIPAVVLTAVGKSNDADYTSALLGLTFPLETLLFQPPNTSRTFDTNGTEGFTLQMKFNYKEQGWNKFWRAKTNAWEEIFRQGGLVYKPYAPADFSALLA
jgi:hypothetical protein